MKGVETQQNWGLSAAPLAVPSAGRRSKGTYIGYYQGFIISISNKYILAIFPPQGGSYYHRSLCNNCRLGLRQLWKDFRLFKGLKGWVWLDITTEYVENIIFNFLSFAFKISRVTGAVKGALDKLQPNMTQPKVR